MTKVIPFTSIDKRNADLDDEIATQDRAQAMDEMADDLLDDLDFERVVNGDDLEPTEEAR